MRSSPSSKNWIEQYREQGFAIFEKLISSDLIDSHPRSYEQLLHQYGAHERGSLDRLPPEERAALDRDIENIYSRPELSLPLCRDQGIHTLASELFGSESVSWTPLTLIWGGGAIPHRDLLGYRDPACEAVRLWIALEDLHDESGLLYVVPGSHESAYRYDEFLDQRPEFLEILRKLARGGTDASSWHVLMKPILDHHHEESACIEASRPKRILRFKKGDALLFDPALVHGSLVAGDPALTRRLRFAPMLSILSLRM
ncbi:MAG TPA: phytanoyl-CoA dioxygenase family protein [Bryobacteraceae bacterium]|nr:phytanoyl-CoA dioxygenase family protein [Bryobacteraceae bacterium]